MELCHCGKPVMAETKLPDDWAYNPGLYASYCHDCALVRCDAYPGACR